MQHGRARGHAIEAIEDIEGNREQRHGHEGSRPIATCRRSSCELVVRRGEAGRVRGTTVLCT